MRKRNSLKLIMIGSVCIMTVMASSLLADEIAYDAGKRRDPFAPLPGSDVLHAGGPAGFSLEGIIYDPAGTSMAIINGQPFGVGDTIGEARVVRINRDCVVVEQNEEEKTLWIREDEQTQNNDGGAEAS